MRPKQNVETVVQVKKGSKDWKAGMPRTEVLMGTALFVFGIITLAMSLLLLIGAWEHKIYYERVWPIFILGVLTIIPYVGSTFSLFAGPFQKTRIDLLTI